MSDKKRAYPFELITIDLDGTLVDSVGDLHHAIMEMQANLSRPISSEVDVRNWVGNGIDRLVHRALSNSMEEDAESSLFNAAVPLFETAYTNTNGNYAVLFPGVQAGLQWLDQLDIPMVVVTNKARRFAEPLIIALKIDTYFDFLIAGDDVNTQKPHPAALIEAAKRCKAMPENSILIGDSISDIKAANSAGFASISVSYGYNHGMPIPVDSGEWQTDALIDSFAELPEVFQQLGATPH